MADTPDLFNAIAAHYDRYSNLLSADGIRVWRRHAIDRLALQRGNDVLDVGCGTGTATVEMARRVAPNGRITGIDPSPEMLAVARTLLPKADANVQWLLGRAEALPFAAQSFDRVSAFFSLRNMGDWRHAVREIHRVLRPGGLAAVLDMLQPASTLGTLVLKGLDALTRHTAVEGLEPFRWLPRSVLHAPTANELRARLETEGFHLVSTHHWLGDLVTLMVARREDAGLRSVSSDDRSGTTIVWATNGSESSLQAGQWLALHGLGASTKVHVVTVCPPFDRTPAPSLVDTDIVAWKAVLNASRRLIAPYAGVPVTARLLFGTPAATILRYAREIEANLIVIGQPRRSWGAQRLTGSVYRRVWNQSPIPVLIIRDNGRPTQSAVFPLTPG